MEYLDLFENHKDIIVALIKNVSSMCYVDQCKILGSMGAMEVMKLGNEIHKLEVCDYLGITSEEYGADPELHEQCYEEMRCSYAEAEDE